MFHLTLIDVPLPDAASDVVCVVLRTDLIRCLHHIPSLGAVLGAEVISLLMFNLTMMKTPPPDSANDVGSDAVLSSDLTLSQRVQSMATVQLSCK